MNESLALNSIAGFTDLGDAELAEVNGGVLPAVLAIWAIGTSVLSKIEANPDSYTWMMDWYYD